MLARQIRKPHTFHHELLLGVGDVGLTRQAVRGGGCVHFWAGGLGAGLSGQGLSDCGNVARSCDSGVLGMYKAPLAPQADNIAAPPTRACTMTRILNTFNMQRL